jgi:hypothetical protein
MINDKELLMKMKESELIFDTKIGQMVNKGHQEDKEYVCKILDLLYENFDRVVYVDDRSDTIIGKDKWSMMVSQKYALVEKHIPLPTFPFHLTYDGKLLKFIKPKFAYLMLIGFFKELDEDIYVSLNFKDEELRRKFKLYCKDKEELRAAIKVK